MLDWHELFSLAAGKTGKDPIQSGLNSILMIDQYSDRDRRRYRSLDSCGAREKQKKDDTRGLCGRS
jgi:hypothetical protein